MIEIWFGYGLKKMKIATSGSISINRNLVWIGFMKNF